MKNKSIVLACLTALAVTGMTGCKSNKDGKLFTYEDINFVDKIGSETNDESHNYDGLKVNRLDNELREDFAFGVDASMTKVVEDNGGVFYNQKGQEQDVFQILRRSGVNFVRFRLWNNPKNKHSNYYGGGNNDLATDLAMAKRAKEANLNVMIDFHYSDFWADPDHQNAPREWGIYVKDEIPEAIESYTKEVLQEFKNNGVTVDAIQVGNEINNGMSGYSINWNDPEESFDYMSKMISSGIKGAKSVFKNVRTMIHLANGGNAAEFETFFTAMDKRKVKYDMIGASFYPHLSGSLEDLQKNLDNVSEKTGKPVVIAETSWGFTTEYNEYTENTYDTPDEDVGGYLTSEQAQATAMRDITNVLAKVPNKKGLGIFYWEPGWLPVKNAGWATAAGKSYQEYGDDSKRSTMTDGLATWSNQGLFSYTGKALSSLNIYSYLKEGKNESIEKSVSARDETLQVTLNLADNEKLPETARVVTDFDAIREAPVVWEQAAIDAVTTKGVHTDLKGVIDGKYNITATAKCIQNFVKDPGFEKQGESDIVKDPWKVSNVTPSGDKVVKLDRKKDTRTGKTDLNWYHSKNDFSFKVTQEISGLPAGTYTLTTYILAIKYSVIPHTKLKIFLNVEGGENYELDICNDQYLKGWNDGYQECVISGIELADNSKITIGIDGTAKAGAWAHNDDWELVNNN